MTSHQKCVRDNGLEYDTHSLMFKNETWYCFWCKKEFVEK